MPFARKKKATVKKRRVRKPKPTKSITRVTAGLGFPKQMTMTHKYFETFDMSTISGSTAKYSFRANSMYIPNATGGGHQPYYFDQMSAVYNHWFVLGSKVTFTISPDATNNSTSVAAVYLNDDTTITPTYYALMEQSKGSYKVMPNGNQDPHKLRCSYSAKKTFGPGILANTSLKGSSTADCSESAVYSLIIYPHDITSSHTYNITVMIEYIAVWLELRDVAQS